MSQRARKAVRLCPGMDGISQGARKAVRICLLLLAPLPLLAANSFFDYSPFDSKDQNLFNLIHGQPLPTNAQLVKKGENLFTSSLVITNTINTQSVVNNGLNESIHLDFESYRFNFAYQYGLNQNWNLKLDIPLIHQSGGIFDSAIDNWHRLWGLPRGDRPQAEENQYDVQYDYQNHTSVSISQSSATVGDIQLAVARSLIENRNTSLSAWLGLKLPTGDESKLSSNGAVDYSAWLALNRKLNEKWRINLNAGAVVPGSNNYQNMALSDQVFFGHIMLGWLTTESFNIKLQLQSHTSYYQESKQPILGDTFFLTFGAAINISPCQQMDFAFSEDIKVSTSPDISLVISWRSFPGEC